MASGPTVIVLATHLRSPVRAAVGAAEADHELGVALSITLEHAAASQLPVVVVATPLFASVACAIVAARDVVVVDSALDRSANPRSVGMAIAQGVWARPDSAGWLVIPGDMPMLGPATICAVAAALDEYAVTYAQHLGRPGYPVGFAAELYSELVTGEDDGLVRRMMARYPAQAVEVDDPGAVVAFHDEDEMESLRSAHAAHRALRARTTT